LSSVVSAVVTVDDGGAVSVAQTNRWRARARSHIAADT